MNTVLLASFALLMACGGLLWAILHIQRTNRSIATTWPDWEGIQKPTIGWATLGAAVIIGSAMGYVGLNSPAPSSNGPIKTSSSTEVASLQAEVAELQQLLSEATRPTLIASPQNEDAAEEPGATETAGTQASPPTDEAQDPNIPLPEFSSGEIPGQKVDPEIEELSRAVIKAIISGSVKPLEPVADQSLVDQFTINPFNFSQLQYGLKDRLTDGYTPSYLGSLRSSTGTTYLWKLQTVKAGPDILERLAIRNGRILGFRFDGIQ